MKNWMNSFVEIAKNVPFDAGAPVVNGPSVFGVSPGKPCLFTFPVRGERPLVFSVEEGTLPPGIVLDAETGRLSGQSLQAGEYRFRVAVRNVHGRAEKDFCLFVAAGALARTPLLGWTSWNALDSTVTRDAVLENARLLVSLGLAARGYAYVNVDSCWQGSRDPETKSLQGNSRFPDIPGMVAEIHALGLKAGIYSTPMVIAWGSRECELLPGSTGYPLDAAFFHSYFGGCGMTPFEESDARQWAEWGFDYLKYDWPHCDVVHTARMSEALKKTSRDFVFSLTTGCHFSEIAELKKNANMFRSNGDTRDLWESIRANAYSSDGGWAEIVEPGAWFDLDMLALGSMHLTAPNENRLTRDEKIFHFSFWALFPSPIQLSCDLKAMNSFDLDLVSNEEILAIQQDYPAHAAVLLHEEKVCSENGKPLREIRIYRRELSSGSAFGFFNFSDTEQTVRFDFGRELSLRDPWALRDLGKTRILEMVLPPHGARVCISLTR